MKIKFNWGFGITAVIVLFFTSVVIRMIIGYDIKNDLVSEDYYPKSIEYDKRITSQRNGAIFKDSIDIKLNVNDILISFPEFFKNKEKVGQILFYYPADYKEDKKIKIDKTQINEFQISKSEVKTGRNIIKIEWRTDSISYYIEKEIIIK